MQPPRIRRELGWSLLGSDRLAARPGPLDEYLGGIPGASRATRDDSFSIEMLSETNLAKVRALNEIAVLAASSAILSIASSDQRFRNGFERVHPPGDSSSLVTGQPVAVAIDGWDPDDTVFSDLRPYERALFDCVVNAYSAIESLFHAIYVIASIIRPSAFPVGSDSDLRRISPRDTMKRLALPDGLPNDRMTKAAKALLASAAIAELQGVRNAIVHRGTPIGLGAFVNSETGGSIVMLSSEGASGPIYIGSTTGVLIAAGTQAAIRRTLTVVASTVERRFGQ